MEEMHFEYPARTAVPRRAHVGVVGSGDLEILLEPMVDTLGSTENVAGSTENMAGSTENMRHPAENMRAVVRVRTRFDGYGEVWKRLLDRFFESHPIAATLRVNDFGATPGMVSMRLLQALEVCGAEETGAADAAGSPMEGAR